MNSKKYEKIVSKLTDGYDGFTKKFFNFICRDDQLLLAHTIFYYFLLRKRHTINVSICRQVGKTEVIVMALVYMLLYFESLIGERIRVCITAPEKGTSTEFFDRLKLACDTLNIRLKQSNNDLILFTSGNRVDKFGLFKAYAKKEDKKTTREGRTFHIVVRDEKHMGDDYIYSDEIEPAMSTTGGLDILIGNGGFKQCKAKQIADLFSGQKELVETRGSVTNFQADFDTMKRLMLEAYEQNENEMFMRWLDSQEAYIREHGKDSHLVLKNLYNKWITEVSNLIGLERLQQLRQTEATRFCNEYDLGLDLAKSDDETVLTFTDHFCNIRQWVKFKGEYTEQVKAIRECLYSYKLKTQCDYRYLFVDSTGVGDPVKAMLKEEVENMVTVRGIVFSAKEKDTLARKALRSFSIPIENERLSYPANHEYTEQFEKQTVECQKIIREDGKINYKHQDYAGAKDDMVDSVFLSIYALQNISTTVAFSENTIDN